METVLKTLGAFVLFLLILAVVVTLTGYFVMWSVNFLFTPAVLMSIFGTAKLGFWQAWVLSFLAGTLFKSTDTSSKK